MQGVSTGFFTDEWCFWHSAGLYANVLPVGGWVQPPSGAVHAESPESKRRLKNLIDVSGLAQYLHVFGAEPLGLQDLLRIHPQSYLDRFKKLSDQGGGDLNESAPIGLVVLRLPHFLLD